MSAPALVSVARTPVVRASAPVASLAPAANMKKTTNVKYYKPKLQNIYSNVLITRKVHVSITNVGSNIKKTLENIIASQIEGKCVVEGFVKPVSTKIQTYSSGLLKGSDVIFDVTFECMVCSPVEGMLIQCIAKNITKAGIRAETSETNSPVVIFIARDHHYMRPYFSTINENDEIKVRVIGQRFELNDKYISIIAELIEPKPDYLVKPKPKPYLNLKEKKTKIVIE